MPALITFGRILFAVLFVYTGATKLFAIQATSDFIAAKVTIPALLAPYTGQLETMTGMTTPLGLKKSVVYQKDLMKFPASSTSPNTP